MLHLRTQVRFADEAAEALLGGRVAMLSQPGGDVWRQVKHNVSRTVYRGRLGEREIYLKHYHSPSLVHRISRRLGFSDALREMSFSRYLCSRGVPTPPALAATCAGGREWLATESLSPVVDADAWHRRQLAAGPAGRRAIRQALVAVAGMIGRMHAAGVLHRDLHCGNILLRTVAGGVEPVLTDLHRMSRRRRLSRRACAANLAQLLHDRRDLTTRTERLRFLKHYLATAGSAGTLRGWSVMVEDSARRHAAAQHAQRDRRIAGNNRYFTRLRLPGGWRGHAVLESKRRPAGSQAAELTFRPEDWQAALAQPEGLFAGESAVVVKDSPGGLVVRRRLKVGAHDLDVFIRRRRRKRAWKLLPDCFRPARALRAFRLGHALLTRGIGTALPLAAMERRRGPFLLDSLLITEALDGSKLNQFLDAHFSRPRSPNRLGPSEQRQLAQGVLWQLGRLLQRLHDHHFAHRSLKASNLLVSWTPGEPPRIVLMNLNGVRRVRRLTTRQRFQGLMRLNVSLLKCPSVNHAGRLRMLLGYLRRPGSGRIPFKPYWRALDDWSNRKLAHQIRSRRRRQKAVRRPSP